MAQAFSPSFSLGFPLAVELLSSCVFAAVVLESYLREVKLSMECACVCMIEITKKLSLLFDIKDMRKWDGLYNVSIV